jgi:hypothetical protein
MTEGEGDERAGRQYGRARTGFTRVLPSGRAEREAIRTWIASSRNDPQQPPPSFFIKALTTWLTADTLEPRVDPSVAVDRTWRLLLDVWALAGPLIPGENRKRKALERSEHHSSIHETAVSILTTVSPTDARMAELREFVLADRSFVGAEFQADARQASHFAARLRELIAATAPQRSSDELIAQTREDPKADEHSIGTTNRTDKPEKGGRPNTSHGYSAAIELVALAVCEAGAKQEILFPGADEKIGLVRRLMEILFSHVKWTGHEREFEAARARLPIFSNEK